MTVATLGTLDEILKRVYLPPLARMYRREGIHRGSGLAEMLERTPEDWRRVRSELRGERYNWRMSQRSPRPQNRRRR
jgi:hypothetical protein